VTIDTVGGHGWVFSGPHDSNFYDIFIVDASANADATYNGLHIATDSGASSTNGRFSHVHVWCRYANASRPAYALYSSGANEFTACHFEGCRKLVRVGVEDHFANCVFYAYFGANGNSLMELAGTDSIITGCFFHGDLQSTGVANPNSSIADNPDCYAINFGSTGGTMIANCRFLGFALRSPFNFATSAGGNFVKSCAGWCIGGGVTSFGGAIASTDTVEYVQGGTTINYIKPYALFGFASAANDAAAAALGVPVGGLYQNSTTHAVTVRVV
jgi:hypothetical protein